MHECDRQTQDTKLAYAVKITLTHILFNGKTLHLTYKPNMASECNRSAHSPAAPNEAPVNAVSFSFVHV